MRSGRPSRTAQFVAYNRALGNLAPQVTASSDPLAIELMPDNWKARIQRRHRWLDRKPGRSPYPFWLRGMGLFNQFRTVVLDRAIVSAAPVAQLVVLGAGFDTRGAIGRSRRHYRLRSGSSRYASVEARTRCRHTGQGPAGPFRGHRLSSKRHDSRTTRRWLRSEPPDVLALGGCHRVPAAGSRSGESGGARGPIRPWQPSGAHLYEQD
jgi:hypothetical protein